MKKGVLFVLFSAVFLLVQSGFVSAQELEFDPCDPQQVEVVDESCFEEEPIDEEVIEVDTNVKGEPNPETVAGNEQVTPQTGVLGASTTDEPQILAATGLEAWVFVLTGAAIVSEVSILYLTRSKQKN
jgi:hypothetical protein